MGKFLNFPKESTLNVPKWFICNVLSSVPNSVISVFPVSKIQKEPKQCAGSVLNWYI